MTLLARIRSALIAQKNSPNAIVRSGVGVLRLGWRTVRPVHAFLSDDAFRSSVLLKLRFGEAVQQTTTLTWMDRYPVLFAACRERLGDSESLRLLSYGCSTGEEVLTLRRYFPRARITGAEINPKSLAQARQHRVDDRIAFVESRSRSIEPQGPFDAIFCMAVLQRTPHMVEAKKLESLDSVYPFERFDQQLTQLDNVLKPGGLLIVHHTQYVFEHATIAPRYRALEGVPVVPDGGPRFDRRSRLIETPVETSSIFVKLA